MLCVVGILSFAQLRLLPFIESFFNYRNCMHTTSVLNQHHATAIVIPIFGSCSVCIWKIVQRVRYAVILMPLLRGVTRGGGGIDDFGGNLLMNQTPSAHFLFLNGDQPEHTNSTLKITVSLQWLSELRRLRLSISW